MLSLTPVDSEGAESVPFEDTESKQGAKLPPPRPARPVATGKDRVINAKLLQDMRKGLERINNLTAKTYHQPFSTFTPTVNTKSAPATDADWRKFSSYLEVDALTPLVFSSTKCQFADRRLKDW